MEHLRDIHHVPEFERLEIQHFFEVYKALEPGKLVQGEAWADRAAAEAEIEACRKRLAETTDHGENADHHCIGAEPRWPAGFRPAGVRRNRFWVQAPQPVRDIDGEFDLDRPRVEPGSGSMFPHFSAARAAWSRGAGHVTGT